MAPQSKRISTGSVKASPAKKSRTSKHAEDPVALVLDPILEAIAASKEAASSYDVLRAALPHCFADAPEERHSFQTKILDLAASTIKGLEEQARTDLAEAESTAERLRAAAAVSSANADAARKMAEARKEQSDAKGVEVEQLQADVKSAKLEVQAEVQKKEAFLADRANLTAEQEAFEKVLQDLWEPLKTSSFANWRARDKACKDLIEKMRPLSLRPSLLDALQVALKMKQDKRSSFAQTTLSFGEEALLSHKASLANRIANTGAEEIARDDSIAAAETKLAQVQAHLEEEEKAYMDVQNSWVDLENQAVAASTAATKSENEVQDALEDVAGQKSELEAAVGMVSSFAALREKCPATADQEPEITPEPPVSAMDAEATPVAA